MNINPFELLKNAQEIQKRLAEGQERLGHIQALGSAGGGMVELSMNGRMEAQALKIAPELLRPGANGAVDAQLLQDLILLAIRDAQAKVQAAAAKELGGLAGGLDLGAFGQPGS